MCPSLLLILKSCIFYFLDNMSILLIFSKKQLLILIHYFFFCFKYSNSFISPIGFIISLFLHALDLAGFLKREHAALLTALC